MGSTSSWNLWISLRAERAFGLLGFCLTFSFAQYSFLGHLVAIVEGGWGTPLTGVAVALLANIKGGCTVSVTVSVCKVGVDDTTATGGSQFSRSLTGEVGGCAHKSCTRAWTSSMVWGWFVFFINSIHSSAHFGGLRSGQRGSQTGPVCIITGELKLRMIV